MKVQVKYFASIREAIGVPYEQLETTATTLGELRNVLLARSQAHAQSLAHGRALRMALNQVMAEESTPLTEGAEVAFFPPVTGG
jgi:molybdopterin synthase sulfur carrier subunit